MIPITSQVAQLHEEGNIAGPLSPLSRNVHGTFSSDVIRKKEKRKHDEMVVQTDWFNTARVVLLNFPKNRCARPVLSFSTLQRHPPFLSFLEHVLIRQNIFNEDSSLNDSGVPGNDIC